MPVASTGTLTPREVARTAGRGFPLAFFNPLMVAASPPRDLQRQQWVAQAVLREDSSLTAAVGAADRMLALQTLAAIALGLGIVLTVRAARVSLKLTELRSDFVSSVTHEFKTPIATIRAAGEALASGRLTEAGRRAEYAGFIIHESRRLARLVDNLLAFSRLTDVSSAKHHFEPLVLQELVGESLQRFELHLADGHFEVTVDVPPDLPSIDGDPSAFALLLDNLIDNAIRHSRQSHCLKIRATTDNRVVTLQVADNGGGIADDEIKHVMRKFFRGRNAGPGGTGLGLAIASRIVSDHGGTLKIVSDVGVGTTVAVTMPVHSARRTSQLVSSSVGRAS
jgi:signal transduction histidine kinase